VLAALDAVAAELSATPAQVALAWLSAKITAPIASATSVAQLHEILGAARVELSDAAVAKLDRASAPEG
jgi:aryl-alcohol dehydrogenase-like predicted oxidoreductase